jgi:hypothetical protein
MGVALQRGRDLTMPQNFHGHRGIDFARKKLRERVTEIVPSETFRRALLDDTGIHGRRP